MIKVDNLKKANRVKIETVIKNMKRRGMTGHYAEDREEAFKLVMDMIPEGSTVGRGGSETLAEIGVFKALAEGNYRFLDGYSTTDFAERKAIMREVFSADFMVTSANAVTLSGEIVNVDGTGNRMSAVIWGPDKVIVVVGANKLVESVDQAMDRIKCNACPPNAIRLGLKTPCAVTGKCADCISTDSTMCCHTVVTRCSRIEDRIHVILVNESLGF